MQGSGERKRKCRTSAPQYRGGYKRVGGWRESGGGECGGSYLRKVFSVEVGILFLLHGKRAGGRAGAAAVGLVSSIQSSQSSLHPPLPSVGYAPHATD